MTRELTYHISGADAGMKIEDYLKQLGCSHHVLTHLKRTECGIVLNGSWAYASQAIACSCTSQKKPARNRSFRSGFLFVLSMKMRI